MKFFNQVARDVAQSLIISDDLSVRFINEEPEYEDPRKFSILVECESSLVYRFDYDRDKMKMRDYLNNIIDTMTEGWE